MNFNGVRSEWNGVFFKLVPRKSEKICKKNSEKKYFQKSGEKKFVEKKIWGKKLAKNNKLN